MESCSRVSHEKAWVLMHTWQEGMYVLQIKCINVVVGAYGNSRCHFYFSMEKSKIISCACGWERGARGLSRK